MFFFCVYLIKKIFLNIPFKFYLPVSSVLVERYQLCAPGLIEVQLARMIDLANLALCSSWLLPRRQCSELVTQCFCVVYMNNFRLLINDFDILAFVVFLTQFDKDFSLFFFKLILKKKLFTKPGT